MEKLVLPFVIEHWMCLEPLLAVVTELLMTSLRHFHRPFNYTTDLVHLPCDFDSTERKNVWVLCDFNVQEPIDQVDEIPLQSWKIAYDTDQKA